MLPVQLEMHMAGVPPSPQAMLQCPGMEVAMPQAMTSMGGTQTRQLRMALVRMLAQELQEHLLATIPQLTMQWGEALR